tara:strand:- start:399391 stop:399600 length:210 start_codon:yes stop_codon:yes gene_type:complete
VSEFTPKVGSVAFVRVVITGKPIEHSFVPSVPITEIDADGVVLLNGFAHPDAIISSSEIKMKLLSRGSE